MEQAFGLQQESILHPGGVEQTHKKTPSRGVKRNPPRGCLTDHT